MKPIEIRHALELAGYTQAQIARDLNRAPQIVHDVIAGKSRSAPVEACIAALLEKSLAEVFPTWHGPDQRRRRKPIRMDVHLPKLARVTQLDSEPDPLTTSALPANAKPATVADVQSAVEAMEARLKAVVSDLERLILEGRRHDA